MYILQQLYLTNLLSTACLGQVIIKIIQLKILLRVQWTGLVVRGLKIEDLFYFYKQFTFVFTLTIFILCKLA